MNNYCCNRAADFYFERTRFNPKVELIASAWYRYKLCMQGISCKSNTRTNSFVSMMQPSSNILTIGDLFKEQ